MFLHPAAAFLAAQPIRGATTLGLDRNRLPLAERIRQPKRPTLGAVGSDALVETESGWRRIADLVPGTAVHTRDGGLQRVETISIHPRLPAASPRLVRVPGGVLGNCSPLALTPEAQVLIASEAADAVLGVAEVLVPAVALDGWRGIRIDSAGPEETVATLRFARDEIVWLNSGVQMLCGRDGGYRTSLDAALALDLLALEGADLPGYRLAA